MSKIGTFNKAADGSLTGTVHTWQGSREVVFQKIKKKSERAPSYIAKFAGVDVPIGVGWLKTAKESGNQYVSVMMDDPAMPAPLYTRLVKDKDGENYSLYWERANDSAPSRDDVAVPAVNEL